VSDHKKKLYVLILIMIGVAFLIINFWKLSNIIDIKIFSFSIILTTCLIFTVGVSAVLYIKRKRRSDNPDRSQLRNENKRGRVCS